MLGKIEGKRRRRWQRMRWLDSITDSMDISSVQSLSQVWLFATPWTAAHWRWRGLKLGHELVQTPSIVLQVLYLSDLIPWIYLSLSLYKLQEIWRTGKPGVLQSMGSHRQSWATEQQRCMHACFMYIHTDFFRNLIFKHLPAHQRLYHLS